MPAKFAVGRRYSEELGSQMRQAGGAQRIMVIRFGEIELTSSWPGLMRIYLDAAGNVRAVSCD